MSNLLWKYYHNDEIERFRQVLASGISPQQFTTKTYNGGTGIGHHVGGSVDSPGGALGASPKALLKSRKTSGQLASGSSMKGFNNGLGRMEVNSRDHAGLTILHRAVSSTSENAIAFAMALLEHPAIDLYIQDLENGWTALHRALYFGNITLARAIIEKDNRDPSSQLGNASQRASASVIKVKDHEGNSPFDVYNATIARRVLQHAGEERDSDDRSQESDNESVSAEPRLDKPHHRIEGEEVWCWGSNRNHGLGFKDGDDRQHPEKITLQRPEHLLFRFYREYIEGLEDGSGTSPPPAASANVRLVTDLPTLVTNRPIVIQDVALSKLHSAILTTDPESNLYMCGFGPGGRLGTGDEVTRLSYTCIEEGSLAGKKITCVALGQNHTLALTSDGEVTSFGTNTHGQLGYTLPRPAMKDEEPICVTPRQIFGPLKRERVIGIAASAVHSVAHTSTSLFTWGKNEGQLGLMDSDSRSLEVQAVPRKVAASLFKSHITMVSAINKATVVLLANHTVCVFTNYGYNIVKFPLHEGFTNYHLKSNALTTRYDSMSNHISYITAGGDTIAAVSSRGDLFTLNVRKIDISPSASTTNPSKIKDSLSIPERVWSLRKGNWDGIKAAAVAENGSVIVCTHAGAVWRRVKRAKNKDAFVGTGYNKKDFKFQRIPGLTKVAAVRSNPFGVYAAIRKDCDVTRTQIVVDEQHLWQDVAPLLPIRDLEASDSFEEDSETLRSWKPSLPKDLFEPLKRSVLTSPDLEADVRQHLLGQDIENYDFEIGTSCSDVYIPVHGFILARSSILRGLISEYHHYGHASLAEMLVIERSNQTSCTGNSSTGNSSSSIFGKTVAANSPDSILAKVTMQSLDFLTIINLLVYLYTDTVIDVWHFTRHSPKMAFRYRQARVELMKTAGHLKLERLESAARLMTDPAPQMNIDLNMAIQDSRYFEASDTIIDLEDSEVSAHSTFLCQRCPFFKGLFQGRANGQWLTGRREGHSEAVRVDLKHISSRTFKLVLNHIYSDAGTEIFDQVVSADIDEFSELVMDVMAVSNELMLDRLSQICQEVIGRFVTTRNVCQLLNAIAPCSVAEFKDSALEYICLQLESMLENHLLHDLEEDLVLELDNVVRANQLNCLPFAKSGRAELMLHEQYPDLAEDIHEERQRRVRDMVFRANLANDDGRLSSSHKGRVGSLDDLLSASPSQEKLRRKSKAARNAPFSPSIRPKDSTVDLMFDMDDDTIPRIEIPKSPPITPKLELPATPESSNRKGSWNLDTPTKVAEAASPISPRMSEITASKPKDPSHASFKEWSSPFLSSTKLDMREIMAQASSPRTSSLSMSISAQKLRDEAKNSKDQPSTASVPKLSQKERKKQQQQAMHRASSQPAITFDGPDSKPASPWQTMTARTTTSLKDVLSEPATLSPPVLPVRTRDKPEDSYSSSPRRTASPDTRFAGQRRTVKPPTKAAVSEPDPPRKSPQAAMHRSTPPMPHSNSYGNPASKAEPTLQLSMADIIGQQRREQEVIKEAVAKRSLQEIQEEQAFQEWWDQEAQRTQQEEAARVNPTATAAGRDGKSGGGRGRGRGRGRGGGGNQNRGRGKGQEKAAGGNAA